MEITPAEMSLDQDAARNVTPENVQEAQLTIPERRWLTLEWPSMMRAGDTAEVRLSLDLEEGDVSTTSGVSTKAASADLGQAPNLYDSHHVLAEARLEIAGMEYRPNGEISQAMQPGRPVAFVWSLRPGEAGEYQGTAWLHLRFVHREEGPESQRLLSAKVVEIEVVEFLGLGGSAARVLGSTGTVLGIILGLDGVIGRAWVWLALKRK